MNRAVTTESNQTRLPMPRGVEDIDSRKWRVLCETIYPNARSPESILMALDYCRARGLDPFKRPVHIVPVWNSSLGREAETVWPSINEVQITAARTGAWAGMDEPKWGPDETRKFRGRKKQKGNWIDAEVEVTFPAWCEVTVYRTVGGVRCAFTEPVYWIEAYSRAGGSELPTDMWVKRPRGQIHKVAKAASLRAAFPEEGEYTAEEMEGKEIEAGGVIIDAEPQQPRKRTREEISAEANRKRQELRDAQKDIEQIESLAELDRYEREVLTPEFMAGLGMKQYAVEEAFQRRKNELEADQDVIEEIEEEVVRREVNYDETTAELLRDELVERIESAETAEDLIRFRDTESFRSIFARLPKDMQTTVRRHGQARLEKLPAGP